MHLILMMLHLIRQFYPSIIVPFRLLWVHPAIRRHLYTPREAPLGWAVKVDAFAAASALLLLVRMLLLVVVGGGGWEELGEL
jgi:hypothetical protein